MNLLQLQPATVLSVIAVAVLIVIAIELARWQFSHEKRYERENRKFRQRYPATDFYPSNELVRAVAEERRRAVLVALEDVGDRGVLEYEFLEHPPQTELRRSELSTSESCAQTARLEWELDSDVFLLVERVVDAIVGINRRFTDSVRRDPLVRIAAIDAEQLQGHDSFPWKVVLETTEPEFFREQLTPIQEWLGIRVEFALSRDFLPLDRCTRGTGMAGRVGGTVVDYNTGDRYDMTCEHVLSPSCSSAVMTGRVGGINEPDAALIVRGNPCFRAPPIGGRGCTPATALQVEGWLWKNTVTKSHPKAKNRKGIPVYFTPSIPISGRTVRFPSVLVQPKVDIYGFIPVPLFDRRFSRPGESGTWVFERDSGAWVGMIISGDPRKLVGVHLAGPLMGYFDRRLAIENGTPANLTAITY